MSKILIVDDEESIRYTFESFLNDEGYEVSTANNYDDALNKVIESGFDLIFADIILGGKSGIDLLQEVKKRNLRCPVVIITGFPNVETASDAVRFGAFDYIFKPVRQETLIHIAKMALQFKALHDENEKYRSNLEAIFRSVKDAIITVDNNLVVLEVNKAAESMCGLGRDFIGKPLDSCQILCNAKCLDILQRTIRKKQSLEVTRTECEYKGKHSKVVTLTTSPLIDSKGAYCGAVLVIKDETRLNDLERNLKEREQYHNIIGHSDKIQNIYSLIEDLSEYQTTVLITGESGTGKELVAEAIHFKGNRRSKSLVKVNCSALSENLLESELFGHVKGAFTGADKDRTGRFQRAEGGTIFLDEIGDLSPRMQLRLLRIIQEKEFERVGDSTPIKADVRIIAATNQDLTKKVRLGEFREDLYYRLKVVEIVLPPLRERLEDIPLLVKYFLQRFNKKFNKNIEALSEDVQRAFMDYSWPGNVRELEHMIEHAFVISRQNTITIDLLPKNFTELHMRRPSLHSQEPPLGREAVLIALRKSGWNKSKAARLLGVTVRTIYRKIEKYNITEEEISDN